MALLLGLALQIVLDKNLDLPNFHQYPKLQASTSAQFSAKGLEELIDTLGQKDLILIDLRREPHGFINGQAVAWMDTKKREWPFFCHMETVEKDLLEQAMQQRKIELFQEIKTARSWTTFDMTVSSISTESNLALQHAVDYVRIAVVDHEKPSDAEIDRFLSYMRAKPQNAWIHFHCRGGKGRSSIFIVMLDMMKNAKKESFEEILVRQKKIKFPSFLKKFFLYCKDNQDNFATTWSSVQ